jgi:hypothetical protein
MFSQLKSFGLQIGGFGVIELVTDPLTKQEYVVRKNDFLLCMKL